MTSKLLVSPRVWQELEDAIGWYEEQGSGLGVELANEIHQAFAEIAEHPLRWPRWAVHDVFRKRVLSRYPYVVFYAVDDDAVRIVAVAHMRRRPGYWLP